MAQEIVLLKKFYTVKELSELSNKSISLVLSRLQVMNLKPEFQKWTTKYYSVETKNKICNIFEFEESKWQTMLLVERENEFLTLNSRMNYEE
jgi:hypothetical protein